MEIVKNITSSSNQNNIKNIFENNEDCWFSSHGSVQIIKIEFNSNMYVRNIVIEYQNGFRCLEGRIKYNNKDYDLFELNKVEEECQFIEIMLIKSQDLYNRFCIYNLKIEK